MSADQAPHTTSDCPQPHLVESMLSLVPADGSTIGNTALRRQLEATLAAEGLVLPEAAYWQAQATLIAEGLLVKGQGRSGSVRRASTAASTTVGDLVDATDGFSLQTQEVSAPAESAGQSKAAGAATKARPKGRPTVDDAMQVISYRHLDRRKNNPEVGMVTPATDPEAGKNRCAYDPHLDPALQFDPQRARIEALIDDALTSNDQQQMRAALEELKQLRISGPFTVEAVPFPTVRSLDEASGPQEADASIARTGESGRQHQWRDELLKTGVRGKGGQMLRLVDLESLPTDPDIRHLHASGHLDNGERVVVSFGPEHAALEQRQVANALNEAGNLFPLPKMIFFCAFTSDPEAAKDINAIKGITALKVQMNTDLLTEDLKKARTGNQSFWLMGQPEIEVISGQWIVGSNVQRVCRYEQYQQLSRLVGLAEINGLGSVDLCDDLATSSCGAVRVDGTDAPRGGVYSIEHRRRAVAERHRRVSELSRHRPGIAGGAGDSVDAGWAVITLTRAGTRPPTQGDSGSWKVAEWPDAITAVQQVTADHLPLTTVHYYQVEVHGFDYFDTVKGELISGGKSRIALWALDTDYDDRSLLPRQVFCPMAGKGEGWEKLKKDICVELDESRLHAFQGTDSLPFKAGENRKIAVKIVDDRGIESLKVIHLES